MACNDGSTTIINMGEDKSAQRPAKPEPEKKLFRVEKWVYDNDLEDVLNRYNKEGYVASQFFRNNPSGGPETTTIVFMRMPIDMGAITEHLRKLTEDMKG